MVLTVFESKLDFLQAKHEASCGQAGQECKHERGVKRHLRHITAAAQQHVTCIAHEVQEGAVGGLVDFEAARGALALGRAGHPTALVVHHKGVELTMALPGHRLLEVLRQAVHQVLQPALHYITLHYITLHYITLHYSSAGSKAQQVEPADGVSLS